MINFIICIYIYFSHYKDKIKEDKIKITIILPYTSSKMNKIFKNFEH